MNQLLTQKCHAGLLKRLNICFPKHRKHTHLFPYSASGNRQFPIPNSQNMPNQRHPQFTSHFTIHTSPSPHLPSSPPIIPPSPQPPPPSPQSQLYSSSAATCPSFSPPPPSSSTGPHPTAPMAPQPTLGPKPVPAPATRTVDVIANPAFKLCRYFSPIHLCTLVNTYCISHRCMTDKAIHPSMA